jgi:hypothetical protein
MSNVERLPTWFAAYTMDGPSPPMPLRWEWRAFSRRAARDFALQDLREAPEDAPPTRQDELYVVSRRSTGHVTVRDGRLDIKALLETALGGLELWRPAYAASFPLGADDITAGFQAWHLRTPAHLPSSCELAAWLRDVVDPCDDLRAVHVQKQRTRIVLGECPGERVTVHIDGDAWETIAFEHADPAIVLAAVHRVGGYSINNENYPAALKRITSFR